MKIKKKPRVSAADDKPEDVFPRLLTPPMTLTQRTYLERYCERHHQRLGPGMLLAAMREICREFGLADDSEPTSSRGSQA